MRNVKTPNGIGVLAGLRITDGQVRVLVRHEATDLVKQDLTLEASFSKGNGRCWAWYSYPPEMVALIGGARRR
jgi:hypothetical protein